MKNYNPYILLVGLVAMIGALFVGYLGSESTAEMFSNSSTWMILLAAAFLVMAFVATFQALDAMKYMLAKKNGTLAEEEEEAEAIADEPGFVEKLLQNFEDSKPIEEESEIDLDHDYDGIRELDNNLPPWWLYGFYLTIIFAVVYLLQYHVFQTKPLQDEEYRIEMAEAEEMRAEYLKTAANLIDENSVTLITDVSLLDEGASIYNMNCAVCHANDGGGGVGPNLTDQYWIHGGDIKAVFSTVKYGVAAKGMISWKTQLNPSQMQKVSSYILSMQGTTPANPKESEGELYTPAPVEIEVMVDSTAVLETSLEAAADSTEEETAE